MRKAGSSVLLPFDIEIERTCRRNRKEKRQASAQQQTSAMDPNIGNDDGAENQRALRDYAIPTVNGASTSIRRPAIQANNFEIKPAIIQMIQTSVQFNGLAHEDPNAHIANFLKICDTFRYNGVSDDAIKLRLFPFSLREKAKSWLSSLPPGTITTWDELAQRFLAKFFPPAKTAKLRNDIATFTQFDMESLYEAWERYKEMMRRCPHHGLPKWLQVQTFYNGLSCTTRTIIDAAANGALMSKTPDEAYQLLEEMASNNYQWPSDRSTQRRVAGVHEIDAITALTAQVATLSRQLGTLNVNVIQSQVQVCELCGGNHASVNCQVGSPFASSSSKQANFVSNFQRHQQNAYSNTYNPAWKHYPNFSWSNDQNFMKPPPSFQPQEKKVTLEDALAQLTLILPNIINNGVVNAQRDKMKKFQKEGYKIAKIPNETKEWHDRKAFEKHFAPGHRVLLFNWKSRLFPGKPKTRWLGPFIVTRVFSHGIVEVHHETKGTFKVNGQRLKYCLENELKQPKIIITYDSV
ncbi:DNA-directed DNA polymerase [Melia azedarach]|uniref:DNA-directed DNA polymerase n=1 Tax=Melia azedarach TaxID=155640 RepID=A0ACC1Y0M1_MELAZ|nr:DNA-directed DNA polymerase [Melia azedarach]